MKTKIDKSQLFKMAWVMYKRSISVLGREFCQSFSACLRNAWFKMKAEARKAEKEARRLMNEKVGIRTKARIGCIRRNNGKRDNGVLQKPKRALLRRLIHQIHVLFQNSMRRWTGHGANKNRSTLIETNKINKDMSTQNRTQLSEIMSLAWQFVKRNGYTMSEALKTAWANMKLRAQMKHRIVRFYSRNVDGIRVANETRTRNPQLRG